MTQGLRERKKERTRQLIAETARELFEERGFERVTVAEIARAAEVAEKTVFNYFPTKEDLFYWRLEAFEDELLTAIREREEGESALDAFARFIMAQRGYLADKDPATRERLQRVSRMVSESPALLARERQVFERYTVSLAALLAEETGAAKDDVEPWVAANTLLGIHRAVIDYVRRGVLEGKSRTRLRRDVEAQTERAVASLREGLGSYAVKGGGKRGAQSSRGTRAPLQT